jgi:hypothetical protein
MRNVAFCTAILVAAATVPACVRQQPSFREPAPETYSVRQLDLERDGAPSTQVQGAEVTATFFQSDVQPAIGRLIIGEEFQRPQVAVTVLSHRCWQERFRSAPTIIGERVTLDGRPTTIVGVAPPGFDVPKGTCLWLPRRQR